MNRSVLKKKGWKERYIPFEAFYRKDKCIKIVWSQSLEFSKGTCVLLKNESTQLVWSTPFVIFSRTHPVIRSASNHVSDQICCRYLFIVETLSSFEHPLSSISQSCVMNRSVLKKKGWKGRYIPFQAFYHKDKCIKIVWSQSPEFSKGTCVLVKEWKYTSSVINTGRHLFSTSSRYPIWIEPSMESNFL